MSLGPFLRWAGGKTRVLPKILPLIPPVITGRYREIFLGGGAVFFAMADREQCLSDRMRAAKLSDSNPQLINSYRIVRDEPLCLIDRLTVHSRTNCEAYYYSVRADLPADAVHAAARFIYLNRTCFNGLHRVNAKGSFNVPWGKLKNPDIVQRDAILACSQALQGVELECCDFKTALAQARRGDFVYADPPYLDPSPGAFTAYSGKFGINEADILSCVVAGLQRDGVNALISNADNDLTRGVFGSTGITPRIFHSLDVRRSVGAAAKTRKTAPEILVECPAI